MERPLDLYGRDVADMEINQRGRVYQRGKRYGKEIREAVMALLSEDDSPATQRQIAERMQVSLGYVSKVKKMKGVPSPKRGGYRGYRKYDDGMRNFLIDLKRHEPDIKLTEMAKRFEAVYEVPIATSRISKLLNAKGLFRYTEDLDVDSHDFSAYVNRSFSWCKS